MSEACGRFSCPRYERGVCYCPGAELKPRPAPTPPEPQSAPEDVRLSEGEQVQLRTVIAEGYYDHSIDVRVAAWVERILAARLAAEREAGARDVRARLREAFWQCFTADFGYVDWPNDTAIQTFARRIAPLVNPERAR